MGYPSANPEPGHYDIYSPPQLAWSGAAPFPRPPNVIRIGGLIELVTCRWQDYLFSQDETIIIIWGSSGLTMPPPTGGIAQAQQVLLYDCLKQAPIGSQTFTGFNMAATLNPPDPARNKPVEVAFTYNDASSQPQQPIIWQVPD